ncbi:hypothetical protein BKA70DRAFT_1326143 [Coprinopsis sp. MPI-PUGE-AT-0042]|nr:hypothetical protein BKA70DRAFT_1326143 [Coprinopsis sp. MPI-PUGE-AT-0042]
MASTHHGHMHDFPPEILGLIFLLATPFDYPGRSVKRDATELLLPQVCQRWRDVAQDTPHLWTPVNITVPLPSLEVKLQGPSDSDDSETFFADTLRAIPRYADLVLRWLSHSGEAKLSVNISDQGMKILWARCNGKNMERWEAPVAEMLKEITAHRFARNWRDFRLDDLGPPVLHILLDIPASRLESLEGLDLNCRLIAWNSNAARKRIGSMRKIHEESERHLRSIIERGALTAPSLKRLSLSNMCTYLSPRLKLFPSGVWEGLTHLTIHRDPSFPIPVTTVFGILRLCADTLQFLQVDVEPTGEDIPLPTTIVSLPRLTEGNIITQAPRTDSRPYSEYFALIHAPILSTLRHTWGMEHARGQGKLPFMAFLEANQTYLPNLTHITLTSYHWIQESEFNDLLAILGGPNSGISSLDLGPRYEQPELDWEEDMKGHAYFTPDVLKRFHRADRPLFPRLEGINWTLRFEWEAGPDDLLSFLIHRLSSADKGMGGLGRLQEVSATFDGRREVRVAMYALYEIAAEYDLDLNIDFGLRPVPSDEEGDEG